MTPIVAKRCVAAVGRAGVALRDEPEVVRRPRPRGPRARAVTVRATRRSRRSASASVEPYASSCRTRTTRSSRGRAGRPCRSASPSSSPTPCAAPVRTAGASDVEKVWSPPTVVPERVRRDEPEVVGRRPAQAGQRERDLRGARAGACALASGSSSRSASSCRTRSTSSSLARSASRVPFSVADVGATELAASVVTDGAPTVENVWSAPRLVPASLVATSRKW